MTGCSACTEYSEFRVGGNLHPGYAKQILVSAQLRLEIHVQLNDILAQYREKMAAHVAARP